MEIWIDLYSAAKAAMFKKDGSRHYRYRQLETRFDFDWCKIRWYRK